MHSLNAYSPIETTDDEIVISVNNEHPLNALFPIKVTEEWIIICVNDVQLLNAHFPIEVTDDGIVIFDSEKNNCETVIPSTFFELDLIS